MDVSSMIMGAAIASAGWIAVIPMWKRGADKNAGDRPER